MDKIWEETMRRLTDVENRLALVEEIAQEPLMELKAKKAFEPEPKPEPEPEPEKTEKRE